MRNLTNFPFHVFSPTQAEIMIMMVIMMVIMVMVMIVHMMCTCFAHHDDNGDDCAHAHMMCT